MKKSIIILSSATVSALAFWFSEGRRGVELLRKERELTQSMNELAGFVEAAEGVRFKSRERHSTAEPNDQDIADAAKALERSDGPDSIDPAASRFLEQILLLDGQARERLFLRIKNHPGVGEEVKKDLLSTLLRASAEENPRFVLRVLRESPELITGDRDSMGRSAAEIAMRSWARVDPYAALDWIRRMKDRPDLVTSSVKEALVAGAGSVDVALGFKMLAELGDYGGDAAGSLAQQADTPEERTAVLTEMRKVAATLEPSMERTRLENRITIPLLDKAVKDGFRNGSRWISQAGFSKESLGTSPAFDYRKMKSGEVGDWIEWIGVQFLPEAGRATISNLMTEWMKADYQAAALWLQGTNPGSTRDTAITSFLTSAATSNPDEARKWATAMPDDAERRRAMDLIGRIVSESGKE